MIADDPDFDHEIELYQIKPGEFEAMRGLMYCFACGQAFHSNNPTEAEHHARSGHIPLKVN